MKKTTILSPPFAACSFVAVLAGLLMCSPLAFGQSESATKTPELAELLARLEKHPDVAAAAARLQLAQAELQKARREAAQEIIDLRFQIQSGATGIRETESSFRRNPEDREKLQLELVRRNAELSRLQLQLSNVFDQPGTPKGLGLSSTGGGAASGRSEMHPIPLSPMVGKVQEALNKPAKFEFFETPLSDVVVFLQDQQGIPIHIDVDGLSAEGLGTDRPVSLSIRGVPFGAGLQAIEDAAPGLRFVVREYGILVTARSSDLGQSCLSAVALWRVGAAGGLTSICPS